MKKFIFSIALSFSSFIAMGQTIPLRGDTVRVYNLGGSAQLRVENSTKTTKGVAYNSDARGTIQFKQSVVLNDSTVVVGVDTLVIRGKDGGGTLVTAGTDIDVTGTGSSGSPYVVSAVPFVYPTPTVSLISPGTGFLGAGATVTITGTDEAGWISIHTGSGTTPGGVGRLLRVTFGVGGAGYAKVDGVISAKEHANLSTTMSGLMGFYAKVETTGMYIGWSNGSTTPPALTDNTYYELYYYNKIVR